MHKGRSFNLTLFLIAFALLNLTTTLGVAQLKLSPLPKSAAPQSQQLAHNAARTKSTLLTLPFWDDFSIMSKDQFGNPNGKPNELLWKNSAAVWVNSGMGINPPSINVATLDGLDSTFIPYEDEPKNALLNGFTDSLTSQKINLSIVPADQLDSVYLSFFYQWQGNGEAPDVDDYLELDFKKADSTWETIQTFYQDEIPDKALFKYVTFKVGGASYLHDAFQFRLRRFGRKSGPYDSWNVDYIYLNSSRSNTSNAFPDVAITSKISPLFGDYNAVPIKHFFTNKYLNKVSFEIRNLYDSVFSINSSADYTITNYLTNPTSSQVYNGTLVVENVGSLLPPFGRQIAKLSTTPDINQFNPLAEAIKVKINADAGSGNVPNPDFTILDGVNDTTSTTYLLKDYYGYDDGVAENSAALAQPGNTAAVAFDMLTTTQDTLIAVDVYFPDFGIQGLLSTDITVYDDDGGKPGNIIVKKSRYSILRRGINKFSRIPIPYAIVKNRFYVGWSESGNESIKIGLDYSNDTGDKIFTNTEGLWTQNTSILASLMIRPVFGHVVISGLEEKFNSLSVYPNPNNGTFIIRGTYDQIQIINSTGQGIKFQEEKILEETKITLPYSSGLYLIKLRKGEHTQIKKMIVR